MRLARYRTDDGAVLPAVGLDDRWFDLRPVIADIDGTTFATLDEIRAALAAELLPPIATPAAFAPPLAHIGKIVCIGLNYADHAEETNAAAPAEPVLFMKAPDTVVGCADEVLIPRNSTKTDYEVELAVVIGTTARYLGSIEHAARHVGGYAISNDVSEREFQIERGGQWDKGKNCATFNPFGPWLLAADAIADPQALTLRLWVNGELRQDSNTAKMIFGVHHLVWYVSQFMTLYPGDVINTGTPAGVGMARANGYLRAGDVVELEIEQLGRQRQTFRQA